jgi:hypothetical protein
VLSDIQTKRLCRELLFGEWEVNGEDFPSVYHIAVLLTQDGDGATGVTVDDVPRRDATIPLDDDHREHAIEVIKPVLPGGAVNSY